MFYSRLELVYTLLFVLLCLLTEKVIQKTVFADMDLTKLGLEWEQLESMFCAKVPIQVEKKEEKKKTVQLIEPKRQQNVSIFLNTFKKEYDQIRRAVIQLDPCKYKKEAEVILPHFRWRKNDFLMLLKLLFRCQ